jgi:two-component system, cell cycle response regulator
LITTHRLGDGATFSPDEFELVKLFAAHASVALRNAEVHRAVELRAETDPLTGLKNHGTLVQTLARVVDQGQPFALLMIDLDGFKVYNDVLGHEAGNDMLKLLAGTLRGACREADEIFRYGGDEFVIILPGTSVGGALRVAHKIRRAVRAVNPSGALAEVTCSVGIASYPLDGNHGESILRAADRACYAAKRSGRNRAATTAQALQMFGDSDQPQAFGKEPDAPYSVA